MFLQKLANVLLEQTGVNEYPIKVEEGKQPPYKPIYSLEPLQLEALKTYIKINLVNGFIRALKELLGALILLVRKPNGSFRLCVN